MMNETLLKETMATILKIKSVEITDISSMDTIKSWDSLSHMNLILAIEDEFQVSIGDEDVANATSYMLIKTILNELLDKGC
jgi:acyl carrier protein